MRKLEHDSKIIASSLGCGFEAVGEPAEGVLSVVTLLPAAIRSHLISSNHQTPVWCVWEVCVCGGGREVCVCVCVGEVCVYVRGEYYY